MKRHMEVDTIVTHHDHDHRAFVDDVHAKAASLPGWDNLAHLLALAEVAAPAAALIDRCAQQPVHDGMPIGTVVVDALSRLLPPALTPLWQRPPAPSPRSSVVRWPHVDELWLQPAVRVQRGELAHHHDALLVSSTWSPGTEPGQPMLLFQQHAHPRGAFLIGGCAIDGVRRRPDGVTMVDGKGSPEDIAIPGDVVEQAVWSAGQDPRGLDLRDEDDLAALMCFNSALEQRGLADQLRHPHDTDGTGMAKWVALCVDAAVEVMHHIVDPLSARLVLPVDSDGPPSWVTTACERLVDGGLAIRIDNVTPPSNHRGIELVLLDGLPQGFRCGVMSGVRRARLLQRLLLSTLAPLGVLPMGGLVSGVRSEGVVIHRLWQPDVDGPVHVTAPEFLCLESNRRLPLRTAWDEGIARLVPDVRRTVQHDPAQLAAQAPAFAAAANAAIHASFGVGRATS
jgi:hypothetical protein